MKSRKTYSKEFKFQVVLELMSGAKTQTEIHSEYGVHPTMQSSRKKKLIQSGANVFEDKRQRESREKDHEKKIDQLHKTIGQLTVERDWLQKKMGIIGRL